MNIKIGVVSRVKRDGMTLLTPLMTSSLRFAYDLVIMKTRLSESEWFSASACDSDNLVFT